MRKYYIFLFVDKYGYYEELLTNDIGGIIYRKSDDIFDSKNIADYILTCEDLLELAKKIESPNEVEYVNIPEDTTNIEYYIREFFQKIKK